MKPLFYCIFCGNRDNIEFNKHKDRKINKVLLKVVMKVLFEQQPIRIYGFANRLVRICPQTHCVGNVVDHDGRLCSSVIHRSQAVVALLTCRVPDLKLHCGVVQTDRLSEEGG